MSYLLDFGSVLAAFLVFLGGVIAYRTQKRVDQEHELRMMKRKFYLEFIEAVHSVGEGDTKPYMRAISKAAILAPDNVMKLFFQFRQEWDGASQVPAKQADETLSKLMIAMREDVFDETKMSFDEYERYLPIRKSK